MDLVTVTFPACCVHVTVAGKGIPSAGLTPVPAVPFLWEASPCCCLTWGATGDSLFCSWLCVEFLSKMEFWWKM